jgi:hypothetical protein
MVGHLENPERRKVGRTSSSVDPWSGSSGCDQRPTRASAASRVTENAGVRLTSDSSRFLTHYANHAAATRSRNASNSAEAFLAAPLNANQTSSSRKQVAIVGQTPVK